MRQKSRSACAILLGLLGVGPPEDGTNIAVQGGGGRYQYQHTGCERIDSNLYGVNAAHGYAAVTNRSGNFTIAAEGTIEPGKVRRAECTGCSSRPDFAHTVTRGAANLRLGGHWDYGGFELGGGVGSYPNSGGPDTFEPILLPSLSFWAGAPDGVYFWSSFNAGPRQPGPFAGVGHQDARFDLTAGIGSLLTPANDPRPGVALAFDAKPHPMFWPGVDLRYQDQDNWSVGLRLTIHFDARAAGADR